MTSTVTDPLFVIESMDEALAYFHNQWGEVPGLMLVEPSAMEALEHFYDQKVNEFDGVPVRAENITQCARVVRRYE